MSDIDITQEEREAMDRGGGAECAALILWIVVGCACWGALSVVWDMF